MQRPVVVTGLGVVTAIGTDIESFTSALRDGRTGITVRNSPAKPPFAAAIDGFTLSGMLEAGALASDVASAAALRRACRTPLSVQASTAAAVQAWTDARLHETPVPADRIGLVVAGTNLTARHAQELLPLHSHNPADLPASFALRMQDTDHVGTVSHVLGLVGEGFAVGGASASGNVAIIQASRLIEAGAADACLVVGALADLSDMELSGYLNAGAMTSERGRLGWPFDVSHCGFVYGQGSACLVLESARSARARGARSLAKLAGYALRLAATSSAAPDEGAEIDVMTRAVASAGLAPADVSYVSAHGTGAPLGDRTEVAALRAVFGAGPLINATKGLIGHCLSAAGVIEAAAAVVQIRGGFVHPNVGITQPIDPVCRFTGKAAEPTEITFAVSNGFGFGGFNSAVVLANPAA